MTNENNTNDRYNFASKYMDMFWELNNEELNMMVDLITIVKKYKHKENFRNSKQSKSKQWLLDHKSQWHDLVSLVQKSYEDGIYSRKTYKDDIYNRFSRWIEEENK